MASKEEDEAQAEWYAPLGADLSQGDILDDVPFGLIDAPLTICQPPNKEPRGKGNYRPFAEVTTRRGVEFIHAKGDVGRGMVVWPNCQIDKLKNQQRPVTDWFVAIAAVHPMSRLDAAVRDKVVALNRAQFFPLPGNPAVGLSEPSYADLRFIWPVRYSLLANRMAALSGAAL